MFKSPYTVFLNGLDYPYDNIKVCSLKAAADICWSYSGPSVVIDDNGNRVPNDILFEHGEEENE